MAVKRVTIELDDVPDRMSRTAVPASLMVKSDVLPTHQGLTGTPAQQPDYQQDLVGADILSGGPAKKETIGRTPSDLVFAFINRPEFMAVTLVFLAFLISVSRLQTMGDLWLPAVIGGVLNLLWFGIRGVRLLIVRKFT